MADEWEGWWARGEVESGGFGEEGSEEDGGDEGEEGEEEVVLGVC